MNSCCGNFERLGDESLVLQIFTFLHDLRDLLKLRAVCKPWRDALLSPQFARLYKPPSQAPCCVFCVRTQEPDDNDRMQHQSHTELWFPGGSSSPRKCSLPLGPPGSCFAGRCSSRGLVCGRLMEHKSSLVLAVGNPITGIWKTLPPAPIPEPDHPYVSIPARHCIYMQTTPALMTSEGEVSSYLIVVLCHLEYDDEPHLVVEYDSRTCVWERGPALASETPLASPPTASLIYWYSCETFAFRVGYDPETKTWSGCNHHLRTGRYTSENEWLSWSQMFRYNGEDYAVADFGCFPGDLTVEPVGISVWKLGETGWGLISKVSWEELGCYNMGLAHIDHRVDVVGDIVIVSSSTYGLYHPVALSMVNFSWSVPYFKNTFEEDSMDVECSYAFLPSLSARP